MRAKSYINRHASKSRLFRSVCIRCTSVSCKSRITRTTYAHRSHVRSRSLICACVRMRLYVDLVPCLSYQQTTENNSARELDAAGDEPNAQFRAKFTCRLRLYDVTRGAKLRACVDLFTSFVIFWISMNVFP